MPDSSDSESASDVHNRLRRHPKHRRTDRKPPTTLSSPLATATKTANFPPTNGSSSAPSVPAPVAPVETAPQLALVTSNSSVTGNANSAASQNVPSSTSETVQVNAINSKVAGDAPQKACDNIRYRDDINRLHTLYSTMYHASLKMKDFENKVESDDYQSSYRTYCDNYTEYQHLYSRLQSAINIDSIGADKPDSISVLFSCLHMNIYGYIWI